jgi:hypothetical protein
MQWAIKAESAIGTHSNPVDDLFAFAILLRRQ